MTLDTLIEEGEQVKQTCYHEAHPLSYIEGQEYENWKAKCKRFLQLNYFGSKQTEEFEEIERSKNITSVTKCEKLIAILVALRDIPDN